MSDSDRKLGSEKDTKKAKSPAPGEGIRSLDTWKKLAVARRGLHDNAQRESLSNDPQAYMERLGLNELVHDQELGQLTDLERQLMELEPRQELEVTARRGAKLACAAATPVVVVNVGEAFNVAANIDSAWNVGMEHARDSSED